MDVQMTVSLSARRSMNRHGDREIQRIIDTAKAALAAEQRAGRYSHVREFWVTHTKRGPRAYYWSHLAGRALPLPYADAELLEATGQAVRGDKPEWVGR